MAGVIFMRENMISLNFSSNRISSMKIAFVDENFNSEKYLNEIDLKRY